MRSVAPLVVQGRDRVQRWLSIARLLPHAGSGLLTGAVLLNLVLGLMPVAFIVWMSILLSGLRGGADTATTGLWSAFVLAVGALAMQQILAPMLSDEARYASELQPA